MDIALSTTLHTSFDDAVARTRKALAEQGFGVLTEIDVKATLKTKLGEDIEIARLFNRSPQPVRPSAFLGGGQRLGSHQVGKEPHRAVVEDRVRHRAPFTAARGRGR